MENAKNKLLNLEWNALDIELKKYAEEFHVPIIFDEGLALLESVIAILRPKRILEIGTAIGYSAIRMQRVCQSEIFTIERDEQMVKIARENVEKARQTDKIHILYMDALEAFDTVKHLEFDLIFIDAAKAQYKKFFDLYTPLLSSHGVVVCDNMLFHGLIEHPDEAETQSRSVRGLIRKLSDFHDVLLQNESFKTSIFPIGDGVSISVKRN